jgi:uncharacterized protein (DUF885 family)
MRPTAPLTVLALILAGCATGPGEQVSTAPAAENEKGNGARALVAPTLSFQAFLDAAFDAQVALSPQFQTQLGMKTNYDRLDDYTAAADARSLALAEQQLAEMRRRYDPARLSPSERVSFRLFEQQVEEDRRMARWREHGYVFRANSSPAGSIPAFMINSHRVDTVADAQAYVSRLREVDRVMGEIATDFTARAREGVSPPRFVYGPAVTDARNVLAGAPFTEGADTPVWADFTSKVDKLQAEPAVKARLLADGRAALTGPFRQGYGRVIAALEQVAPSATSNDGVWRLPQGDAYYADMVRASTTTDLTPDQIHDIGLREVARIQAEMEAIKRQVGFKGTLQQFFTELKTNPRFEYPNTDAGRQQYLSDAKGFIAQAMAKGPQYFHRLPKAPLEVRAVEKWREATSSVAFYNRGTADGSRPGIYYVNLADMTQVLKPQIEGISYHEGRRGITSRSPSPRSRANCPSSGASAATPPIRRAGASTARSSARRWASTRTPIRTSAGCRSSSGARRGW